MADDNVPGRLFIEDEPHDGAWNMAYDEALLEASANRGETILRIYRWSEPTLSLGWFQKSLPADLPPALASLPKVRRLSGGGAILHHHEWTYSCAVPKNHRFARRTEFLYEEAHHSIMQSLRRFGIEAALRGSTLEDVGGRFLCFLRGDARDVLVRGTKIVGSAQRRRRGAVLQHGSVILKRSPLAPDVPGLAELAADVPHDPLFVARDFAEVFGARLFGGCPSTTVAPEDVAFARQYSDSYRANSSHRALESG